VEERQDRMKVMMEVLISKFDKMISRKEVPSRKEKEVEMPIIKAIMNHESVGNNYEDKENKFLKVDDQKVAMKLVKKQLKENIFHTRCHISNKVCNMIIDSRSCTNIATIILVKKLNLNIVKHDRPYKLLWLNECSEAMVTEQVLVSFFIGKYKDKVLCDVVPIYTSHLLLARP
jgi:hypothetical protein